MASFFENTTEKLTDMETNNLTSQTLPGFNEEKIPLLNNTDTKLIQERKSLFSQEQKEEFKNDIFNGANVIIILSTVFIFILIQTLFFHFIASKQFNEVLKDKVNILNIYKSVEPDTAKMLKHELESESTKEIIRLGKEQEVIRTNENINLILKEIGVIMLIILAMIIYIGYNMYKKKGEKGWFSFTKTDLLLTSLILTGYTTELAFFFGVIRQYKFYGDHNIIYVIYKKVQERINKITNSEHIII